MYNISKKNEINLYALKILSTIIKKNITFVHKFLTQKNHDKRRG